MLSFNDAIYHGSSSSYICDNCGSIIQPENVQWYEALPNTSDGTHIVYDTDHPVVPICPTCHADPASWLEPAYSVPGWLASRPCEWVPV